MATREVSVHTDSENNIFKFIAESPTDGDAMKIDIARKCKAKIKELTEDPMAVFEKWQSEGDMWSTVVETIQGPFYVEARKQ